MSDSTVKYELLRNRDNGRFHRFININMEDSEEFVVFVVEIRSFKGATLPSGDTTPPFSESFSTLEESAAKAKTLRDQYITEGWSDVTPKRR